MKDAALLILILIAFLVGILIGSAFESSGTDVVKFVAPLAFGVVVFFIGLCVGRMTAWS